MAGVFDFREGAFDSAEAALLHRSFDIALHGLSLTHHVDRVIANRLARSVLRVARAEPDTLRYDGTIDPARLAQRAILRMLQLNAPPFVETPNGDAIRVTRLSETRRISETRRASRPTPVSPGKIMMKLFERTPFAKL